MRYLLLLTVGGPFDDVPDPSDSATRLTMEHDAALKQELIDEGVWCGGQSLQPTSMATGVRVRAGQTMICDGSFVKTSDQLIGYYLVDCDDLDHAVEVAVRVPAAAYGAIEIRPIWDYEALV